MLCKTKILALGAPTTLLPHLLFSLLCSMPSPRTWEKGGGAHRGKTIFSQGIQRFLDGKATGMSNRERKLNLVSNREFLVSRKEQLIFSVSNKEFICILRSLSLQAPKSSNVPSSASRTRIPMISRQQR